ncbi:MAG: hypothetical protein ACOVOV_18740 [Dolichospermum sp.]
MTQIYLNSPKKSTPRQIAKTPTNSDSQEIYQIIEKLLSIPLRGWDGTFVRQLAKWRDIAIRDNREFKLNQKQQAHLERIESIYLGGDN